MRRRWADSLSPVSTRRRRCFVSANAAPYVERRAVLNADARTSSRSADAANRWPRCTQAISWSSAHVTMATTKTVTRDAFRRMAMAPAPTPASSGQSTL